jgi:2-methylcitrate dehydratase PrpD
MLLAAETGASGGDQLVAQVVANEVAARLGGACLIGPLNGQLWSFIHVAGTALAAGRLLGLDQRQLAHALALSLYQPPRPTVPGFMAPDSKLLTAAEPAVAGLRAARLAGAGVTGPLDALDSPEGFFSAFSYAPLPGLFGGLGEGWATKTLCVKPYPGCAYVDTILDALFALELPTAVDVAHVEVDASLLTIGMDALSRPYAATGPPSPVNVNFSVPWNVAIAVVAGELTPSQANEDWLGAHHDELAAVASRVSLTHDWSLTAAASEQFARVLPPRAVVADAGRGRFVRALRQVRATHPSMISGIGDLRGAQVFLRSPRGLAGAAGRRRFWDPDALTRFAMTFPARVRVHTRGGEVLTAEASVPRGGAGHPTEGSDSVSRTKLATWGPQAWGEAGTAAIAEGIDTDADDLWSRL